MTDVSVLTQTADPSGPSASLSAAEADALLQRHQQVEEQLTLLMKACSSLIGTLKLDELLPALLELARRVIAADAYAVWRMLPSGDWETTVSEGLSEAYTRWQTIPAGTSVPPPNEPWVVHDVEQEPRLAHRLDGYRAEGIRSLLVVPLAVHAKISGTLTFYYNQPHQFDALEVRVTSALADLAAAAIGTAELMEAQARLRREAEQREVGLRFLAEASGALGASLDYEITLRSLAQLAVPRLADWCVIDILSRSGEFQRLAIAHSDPNKVEWAQELQRRYPPKPDAPFGPPLVMRTGRPLLLPEISDAMLADSTQDTQHLQLLRELGLRSVMVVPLMARGQSFGAITFVSTESGRQYGPPDLALAEELARRASLAVDNARLYQDSQDAIRLREEFLSIASHELRTPMTVLQGYTEGLIWMTQKALASATDDDTAVHLDRQRLVGTLEKIDRANRRLARLVDELLDVARLQNRTLGISPERADLAGILNTVLEGIRQRQEAGPANRRVAVRVEPTPMQAIHGTWDPGRLEQVIVNLIDNAIKYSPEEGGVTIKLTVESGIGDDVCAHLVVEDQGIGIPAEDRERIFQPFARASNVEAGNVPGLGLGLAIAKEIVERHRGRIWVDSGEAGRGSAFHVVLPGVEVPE